MHVRKRSGELEPLDINKYEAQIVWACSDVKDVDAKKLKAHARQPLFDGITTSELNKNLCNAARDLTSVEHPNWTFVAAKFVLQDLHKEVAGNFTYPHFKGYLNVAIDHATVNPDLLELFDFETLNSKIDPKRDFLFDYLGLTTVADRYLLRNAEKKIIELPQHWLMRVAIGVSRAEPTIEQRTQVACRYYDMLSTLSFLSSTPTLFNSGLKRSQLSSCFGIMVNDDIESIMDSMKEAAYYSKYGGGIAMDFGSIRSKGSPIKSMGGEAGGPIPYIKLANDVLIGFDQQGKRKGSGAVYMEPWHADIFDFLDIKEPGDDRVRAHDVFPALWIPDLFMDRVNADGYWSLFDPSEFPTLHETYGDQFRIEYENAEKSGKAKKVIQAADLWYKMLERILAHGTFWHCYKDRANERYALKDFGVIHHTNLCTEIELRDDATHSFVCNLGSINLSKDEFLVRKGEDGKWLWNKELSKAVMTAIRFLDSVIEVGFVPSANGKKMQEEDRPIGLGCMGWTSALYKLGIDYESEEHIEYANEVWKQVSVAATYQSAKLGRERGSFKTFEHSTWAKGQLIHETLINKSVVERFNLDLSFDNCPFTTESELKVQVAKAMRNSTLMAIAPTATISNIAGAEQCTELPWNTTFDKKNLSGTFKCVAKIAANNPFNIPVKTAFEVDHKWTVWAAAARQVWIDQSQSTNFFIDTNRIENFGDVVDDLYKEAWSSGLKTTYYLYGQGEETKKVQTTPMDHMAMESEQVGAACFLRPGDDGFEDCEACQ